MSLQYVIKSATQEESILFYSSTEKNDNSECGCIGHLRGDFGSGTEFYTTFWDYREELKTQEFKNELDIVVNQLRKPGRMLNSLPSMLAYGNAHPAIKLTLWNDHTYGYKVETDKHSYYIRCCEVCGDYNFYIYCYCRESLAQFLGTANQ